MGLLSKIVDRFAPGHRCEIYIDKAKKGELYTCCCGAKYMLTRTFPWRAWKRVFSSTGVRVAE